MKNVILHVKGQKQKYYQSDSEQEYTKESTTQQQLARRQQQLSDKLKNIKNYDSWRKHKNKKIKIAQIDSLENDPIIHIVSRYGHKNGSNQLFNQFVQQQIDQKEKEQKKQGENEFEKILQDNKKYKNEQNSSKLSFLGYKTKYGTDKFNQIKNVQRKTKSRSFSLKHHRLYFPKELQILKDQLKVLPSFIKHLGCRKVNSEPAEISSNPSEISAQQHYFMSLQAKERLDGKQRTKNVFSKTQGPTKIKNKKGRKDFTNDINIILNNSQYILNQQIKQENQRQQERNTVYFKSKTLDYKPIMKAKPSHYLKYWPEHLHYVVPAVLRSKFNQIINTIDQCKDKQHNYSIQLKGFIQGVEHNVQKNLNFIKEQALRFQHNSLIQRYKYKMNFQRQIYKKNVKSLLKCKKEYMIDKRRQQVRANGIKRVKVITKKNKSFEEQDFDQIQQL